MIKTTKTKALSLSMMVSFALTGMANANVTDKDILNDQATTDDVVSYGLGLKGQRYSPLSKINTETVKDMRPVWAFSLGGEKQRGQESQPVIKDGVMYITGSYSRVLQLMREPVKNYGNTMHDYLTE